MTNLRHISDLSSEEVSEVFADVDTILLDIDGVLLLDGEVIPGSVEAVSKVRRLGKKVGFITDNGASSLTTLQSNLESFEAKDGDILTPITALLLYLKGIDFDKEIYVMGTKTSKDILREAGYKIIEYTDIQPTPIPEIYGYMTIFNTKVLKMCKNIGIVFIDMDFNFHYGAVQVAQLVLKNIPDVDFLTGTGGDLCPIEENFSAIGPKYIIDGLIRWCHRTPIEMSKCGELHPNIAKQKFNISESSRVLFIGDVALVNMRFGYKAGFKTCLVLPEAWKKERVENLSHFDKHKPDFVAASLAELCEKIK